MFLSLSLRFVFYLLNKGDKNKKEIQIVHSLSFFSGWLTKSLISFYNKEKEK